MWPWSKLADDLGHERHKTMPDVALRGGLCLFQGRCSDHFGFTDVVKSVPLNMKYMAYTLSIGLKSCLELESVPQSGRPHEFGISQLLSQQEEAANITTVRATKRYSRAVLSIRENARNNVHQGSRA